MRVRSRNHYATGQTYFSLIIIIQKYYSLLQIFNRDEPEREKLVFVTVKATDGGRPQLEDVCTVAVRVADINDNAPVFDRAMYEVPLAQVRWLMGKKRFIFGRVAA